MSLITTTYPDLVTKKKTLEVKSTSNYDRRGIKYFIWLVVAVIFILSLGGMARMAG